MLTLIFNGSPRPHGDTASLLAVLQPKLRGEVRVIDAYRCDIAPCVDCRYCWTHPGCCVQDAMQPLYEDIRRCDNLLIASPIYFSELPGKLLDVCSRLQAFYCARAFRGETPITKPKKGAVLLVGGGDGRMERAHQTAKVLLHQMNATELFPLLSFHNTNETPAVQSPDLLRQLDELCAFWGM